MLPKILKIAEQNGLLIEPRSYGKKETRCKCPFCRAEEEPGKGHNFYLSLNTKDQVFKCWSCQIRGGVLEFESRLTGVSIQELKERYFGKRKKPLHPAYKLDRYQLNRIGWQEYKQKDRVAFKKKRDEVIREWNEYLYKQYSLLFAEFLAISIIEKQEERQMHLLEGFVKHCHESHIEHCFSSIIEEYLKDQEERTEWARAGSEIARMAWNASYETYDFQLDKVVLSVPFLHFFYMEEALGKSQQVHKNRQVS